LFGRTARAGSFVLHKTSFQFEVCGDLLTIRLVKLVGSNDRWLLGLRIVNKDIREGKLLGYFAAAFIAGVMHVYRFNVQEVLILEFPLSMVGSAFRASIINGECILVKIII